MSSAPHPYQAFDKLYKEVTEALRSYVQEGRSKGEISNQEKLWFEALIKGFQNEFDAWPGYKNNHPYRYLELFSPSHVSPTLRLAAHAFLHVAYDLPRVIADNLDPGNLQQRPRLRSLFLRPAPLFRQVFTEQLRAGLFGTVLRPVGYLKSVEIIAYWVLCLRSVAWIHAETLIDSPQGRPSLELDLAKGLLKAGQDCITVGGIPGMVRLDNSTLFQVAAPVAVVAEHPTATLVVIGLVLSVVLVSLFRDRARHKEIKRLAKEVERLSMELSWSGAEHLSAEAEQIAYFGARVYIAVTKAMHSREQAASRE